MTIYELFRKYAVPANSVEDFLARYHRADTYTGRGPEYAASLLASYRREVEEYGCCYTSHHDSNTGVIVAYYPQTEDNDEQLPLFAGAA